MEAGTGILGRLQGYCLVCRDGIRKAKAQLKLNLVRDAKNDKMSFDRYISQKRKTKDIAPALKKEMGSGNN